MKRKIDFALFALFVIVSLALAALAYSFGGTDFNAYYAAAKTTLQGGNPYDYESLVQRIISTGKLNNPYYYAPWFTWSVVPLALLPYPVARVLWAAANYLLWIFSLVALSKLISYPSAGRSRWSMWLFATFVFAWSTWGAEQVGVLILFLFALALLFALRENWRAAGIFLALPLFKPNIAALPVAFIALWIFIRKRTARHLLWMTLTLALFLSVALILDPQFYLPLLRPDKLQGLSYTLDASGGLEIKRYTTTLRDFLAQYQIESGALAAIYGAAILASLLAAGYGLLSSDSLVEFSALAILINFAVVPYALFYDYPLMTVPLFYANLALLEQKPLRYAANALTLAALFVGASIPYRYWITIILSCFFAFGWLAKRRIIFSQK